MLVGLLTYTEYGTRLPIKVRRRQPCRIPPVPLSAASLINPPFQELTCACTIDPAMTQKQQADRITMDPRAVQVVAWCLVGVVSTLIVASRKHYSVDVVVAW
jgi:hypothetical protein